MYRSSGIVWPHTNFGKGMFPSDVLRFVTIRRPVTAIMLISMLLLMMEMLRAEEYQV